MEQAAALALSVAIEAPLAWLAVRLARWDCRGPVWAGVAAALATLVTHPLLWAAALWAYQRMAYPVAVLSLEASVALAEGFAIAGIARLRIGQAMLVSLLANSVSLVVGLLLAR